MIVLKMDHMPKLEGTTLTREMAERLVNARATVYTCGATVRIDMHHEDPETAILAFWRIVKGPVRAD